MSVQTRWRVGGADAARIIEAGDGRPTTVELTRDGAAIAVTESRELAVVLDGADWRQDIEGWRWLATEDEDGVALGFHEPGFDDGAWRQTAHLHPLYHLQRSGGSWFRTTVTPPAERAGAPLVLGLGGLDDEDWLRYRVWVNGVAVDDWEPRGRWRETHLTRVEADAVRFGAPNVIAVETRGLDRTRPDQVPGEGEHYFFQGWLLDQFVAIGEPFAEIADFALDGEPPAADGDELVLELRSEALPALAATVTYRASGDLLRKQVTLRNAGDEPLEVLDVVVEDFVAPAEVTRGGRGDPVFGAGLFAGVEHPAGVNQGDGARVRLVQMPGATLAPGGTLTAKPAVVGLDDDPYARFRAYVDGLRARPDRQLLIYSALGWYDFTDPAAPLFELDAGMVEENMRDLRALGVPFDVYMFDDWWEPTDPERFRVRTFPDGVPPLRELVKRELHALPGLWMSPTSTNWGWGAMPGIEDSLVGGVAPPRGTNAGGAGSMPGGVDPETGKWDWDVVFGTGQTCGPRLCPASEPLRGAFERAVRTHLADLESACLKIDGAIPYCSSTRHMHRAGRYSVEPICDALIEMARIAREVRPDLFFIWYWGLRSPWWLAHGDALFDKGIKLEAATPASAPAFHLRQAIAVNTDQAIRHERRVPLSLMDSLGVWVGNVSWANRLGAAWWREAFVLDTARGSAILQLWGDVKLLDDDDGRFLRDLLSWVRDHGEAFRTAREIGGDPWRAEPYGYAWTLPRGSAVTLFNPGFAARSVAVAAGGARALELFPFPGAVELERDADGRAIVELAPFEVRSLMIGDLAGAAAPSARPAIGQTRELALEPAVERTPDGDETAWVVRGVSRLPAVGRDEQIVVFARFTRAGHAYYHPEPHDAVSLSALMRGFATRFDVVPTARSANGPGYPWIAFRIPAGTTWSGEELRCTLRARLPHDVEMNVSAVLVDPWWDRMRPQFAEPRSWRA